MTENDANKKALLEKEMNEEKERLKRETLAKMFAGAKVEQARFDELQKLRKELKHQLLVKSITS